MLSTDRPYNYLPANASIPHPVLDLNHKPIHPGLSASAKIKRMAPILLGLMIASAGIAMMACGIGHNIVALAIAGDPVLVLGGAFAVFMIQRPDYTNPQTLDAMRQQATLPQITYSQLIWIHENFPNNAVTNMLKHQILSKEELQKKFFDQHPLSKPSQLFRIHPQASKRWMTTLFGKEEAKALLSIYERSFAIAQAETTYIYGYDRYGCSCIVSIKRNEENIQKRCAPLEIELATFKNSLSTEVELSEFTPSIT